MEQRGRFAAHRRHIRHRDPPLRVHLATVLWVVSTRTGALYAAATVPESRVGFPGSRLRGTLGILYRQNDRGQIVGDRHRTPLLLFAREGPSIALVARTGPALEASRTAWRRWSRSSRRTALLEIDGREPVRGRRALLEFLDGARESPSGRFIRHHVSSLRTTVSAPGVAEGSSYFLVLTERGPDHRGRYRDRYALEGDRWVFTTRRLRVDRLASGS